MSQHKQSDVSRKRKIMEDFFEQLTVEQHEEFLANLISPSKVPISAALLAKSITCFRHWNLDKPLVSGLHTSSTKLVARPSYKRKLVGIETNPGPTLKQDKKLIKALEHKNVTNKGKKKSGKVSKPAPRKRFSEIGVKATLAAYCKVLIDPWFAPPVRLGFGTFIPTSLRAAWFRTTVPLGALNTAFSISGTPVVGGAAALTSFVETFLDPLAITSLGTSATQVNYFAANGVALASVVQTARVIAGAMRITVRYPATALRGTLVAGYLADDSRTNFVGASHTQLTNQFQSRSVNSSAAGELTCEIQYRPVDLTSFDYSGTLLSGVAAPAATILPRFYVSGTGWQAGTASIEVNQIFHYECLSGLDAAGEDDQADSLAANGATIDAAGQASVRAGQPVITSGIMLDAIDSALSTIAGSRLSGGSRGRVGKMNMSDPIPSSSTGIMNSTPVLDPATSTNNTPRYILVNH